MSCSCGHNGWFSPPDPSCPEHGSRGSQNHDYQRGLRERQSEADPLRPDSTNLELRATEHQLEDALTFLPPAMRDSFERRVRNLIRFARHGAS